MPRKCTVCAHPNRDDIDKMILDGESLRDIAGRFGTSSSSLQRHKQDHLPRTLLRAQEVGEVARADSLLDQVYDLQARAINILNHAETDGDQRTALAAIREARGCLELQGKLVGLLQENTQVNVLVQPEWTEVRAVVFQALEPHPEARMTVARALMEVEKNARP